MAILLDNKAHTPAPAPTGKAAAKPRAEGAASPAAPPADVARNTESFSKGGAIANAGSAAKAAQPLAGAFNQAPGVPGKSNSLSEHYKTLASAKKVIDRTEAAPKMGPVSAGLATAGAVGLGLAMTPLAAPAALGVLAMGARMFARRSSAKAVSSDPAIKQEVADLTATRDRLRGRNDLTQMETDTLAVAEKALKY